MGGVSLRSRVWNLLETARRMGRSGVSVAVLAGVLGVSPEAVLGAVIGDMVEIRAGCDCPDLYCAPGAECPNLEPRRFPAE